MLNRIFLLGMLSLSVAVNAQQSNKLSPLSVYHHTACDSLQLMQAIGALSMAEDREDIEDAAIYVGSTLVDEIDGRIELICQDTLIVFEDMPEDEYGYYSTHTFIGQLNTGGPYAPFVVDVSYSEYNAVMLINNMTGDDIFLFNRPILSPDKKCLIVFEREPFSETELTLLIYKVGKKDLIQIAGIIYPHSDLFSIGDGVWDEDGTIIFPVILDDSRQTQYLQLEIDMEQLSGLISKIGE